MPFVETVTDKYIYANDELTVSNIEGRYSDLNGIWIHLKNRGRYNSLKSIWSVS
jgi:hypothetical protein